jgi:gamma-glutamylcyclotransferase (GGCT)/AIG2-like uncharacterized protein YtfP
MREHLVFVYGSLRSGNAEELSIRFPDSKFVAVAHVKGSLYDLGAYPGLLLNDASSLVVGEVYEVNDETLKRLDDFEASSDYVRKQVEVHTGADKMKCWIYVPSHGPDFYSNRTLIASGDWMEYAKPKDYPRNNTK